MGLHGKLSAEIEFKAGGELFHELFTYNPHCISTISPDKIQGCGLMRGTLEKQVPLSVRAKLMVHDGKEKIGKTTIQNVDDVKKRIEFKMLEGDLLEEHKDFLVTLHIEPKNGIDLVTCSLEYETLNEDVEHPISLLDYFIHLTKDIEAHHLK